MEVNHLILLITLFGGLFENVRCIEILRAEKDVCRYFKDGVKLRKPGYCSIGIQCKNFKSVEYLKCANNMFYDRNTMKCAKTTTDAYCNSPCTIKTNGFVEDTKNCLGWYKCNGRTQILSGYCDSGLIFNGTTQMCDYAEKSSCEATYDICDVAPNSIPFQYDEDDCGTYRECVKGRNGIIEERKTCDNGKYFDVKTGTCISKNLVNCSKYPYPETVCGTTKLALRDRFVGDGATCRGYFYCKDLGVGKPDSSPQWGQCPVTTFFEPTEMACMSRTHVKCNEDRCDGRDDGYELSSKNGCRYYLVCKNDRTLEEKYCGDNMWFDTTTQNCTSTQKTYPACS